MRRSPAFTLIELMVVIAIIALLISILLPSLSRARELSKRLVCASNLKGIGTSAKLYANNNAERWMQPGFDSRDTIIHDSPGIDYIEQFEDPPWLIYRRRPTTRDANGVGGSTVCGVTRAYWMLVRSGDVTVKQFVCPSSGDEPDDTENLETYYDFAAIGNVSYGYQVPFGPRDTSAREGSHNQAVFAADQSPFYDEAAGSPDWAVAGSILGAVSLTDSPRLWRAFNSPNHGGSGSGEGQNGLFADGHVSFERLPAIGVDRDNIYTVMENDWAGGGSPETANFGRIHGLTVHQFTVPPYPGKGAFGNNISEHSSTDTLLYP